MSSKKGKRKENQVVTEAKKSAELRRTDESQKTQEKQEVQEKAEVQENQEVQEKQKEPEVSEIQEIKEVQEEVRVPENSQTKVSKKALLWRAVFGGILTAAIVFLAVCLYKTSADLRSVQAFSNGLQTELNNTEMKLNEVLKSVNGNRTSVGNTVNPDDTTDEPVPSVTSKPRPTPVPEVYTVCIDAGHGGYDGGAVLVSEDGTKRQEKDDNLRLAKLVQAELETYGVKVIMTREDDTFIELYDRTLMANAMDADALISFHRNAYYLGGKMSERVGGVEIWIHSSRPTQARQLANRILDAILDVGGMEDRGVRYGSMSDGEEDYAINRRSLMPSMIIEMGFISNAGDNEAFDTNGEAYAKAIAKEVYEWLESQR